MSILLSDQDKISCKTHKYETCIVADLNTKGKKDVNFLCIKCLLKQHSNQKLTLIEDTKKLISQMKSQKMEKQTKENEAKRETFKNVLSQIKEFKITLDLTFDKMTSFVQQ
ncbi:unnamed protein product [Paramecium sonneborni]|uniref:Uncharacterized protein n=1 Tax=Paramecium sonneborni TaxID=65129 RepID=A0A8S1RHN0_9CILI|nr:unnamed protein product [Paramecium sonneborni]